MKKRILVLCLIGFIPLSITSVFGQIKTEKTEVAKAQIIKKEFFNYETLDVVFEQLKTKYGFIINYKKEDAAKYNLTYAFNETPPQLALEICLRNTPLGFVRDDTGVFYIYDKKQKAAEAEAAEQTRFSGASSRQNFTLSGIIKDKITGEPLPFVNILLSRTSKGTATNVDGYFSLLKVPNDTTTLEVSYIGYKNKTIFLTPKTPLSNFLIELEPQAAVLDEFTVAADREELLRASEKISMLKLTPAKISALPSVGEKDIMRAFQLMPGVSAANENSSGLYVRGGTPDQTLVLYDGFNVYHVEHLFGFFSAFNPNAIKDVQLYKGGFESKFGGRIGSVAEITGKEGNSKGTNVGIDAGFLAANAFVEVPIGDKFTSMFAFRRSYQTSLYDKIFKKYNGAAQVASIQQGGRGGFGNRFNTTVASYFYDLNAKFTYKPTTKDILTLSLYNGTDNMDNSRKTPTQFAGRGFNFDVSDLTYWGNLGGSFKWSRRINDRFYVNTLVSYSNYYSQRDRSTSGNSTQPDGTIRTFKTGLLENNNLKDYSFKTDFEWSANRSNKIEFGTLATYNDIIYKYQQNDTSSVIDRHTTGVTFATYIQDKIVIAKGLNAIIGVRDHYFTPTSQNYIEPRASLTYDVTKEFKLKAAYGQYNQFAKRVIREDVLQGSRDFWVLADGDKLPVSHSTHYIVGGSYETKNWLLDVEAYRKDLTGLTEYSLRIQPNPRQINYKENYFQGTGVSNGIDVLLQKKYGKLNGWLSYSLAKTLYNFPNYGAQPFYASQDVRHEFKAVGIYKLGNIDLSATWIYASGRPYTAPSGGYTVTLLDGTTKSYIDVTDKNGLRLPDYHRMDLAATFNWHSPTGANRSIGLSLFNVYNRTNVWYNEFQIQDNKVIETNVNFLGFTPNLNLSWRLR
jgi:ferric enterobactin receptor